MKDATTKQKRHVSTDGTAGSYITAPFVQSDELLRILDGDNVRHSVDENVISLDGEPEVATADLVPEPWRWMETSEAR